MTDQASNLYRRFWRWHFFAAAIVIPFVLWQSVTGTLYLWSEWWIDVRHPEMRFVEARGETASYAAQIRAALAAAPNLPVTEIVIPADPGRSTTVLFKDGALPVPVFVDPHGARLMGTLTPSAWLPGWSRALHAGWPLGSAGNYLLELGDCWAVIMVVTGLYLWWPRGRSFLRALWPRWDAGGRVLLRDLHSCVAVWFSLGLLFFLVSALPWTRFWGGEILPKIQSTFSQENPAGFSPGGASAAQLNAALPTLDSIVAHARASGIQGDLDVRLAPWPDAPWWVRNQNNAPGTDRFLLADTRDARPLAELGGGDLPLIPRLVALGIHVHQGDFGPVNLWLNTALAAALVWLSATGVLSWWQRRPPGRLAAPPRVASRLPAGLVASLAVLCLVLPMLAMSVLALLVGEWMIKQLLALRPQTGE